jgi:hypothetical protein
MSTIDTLSQRTICLSPLKEVTISNRVSIIAVVVLAALTVLIFSLSAWANVKVATLYGTGGLLKHSIYTTLLPLTITSVILRFFVLLFSLRRAQPLYVENPLEASPLPCLPVAESIEMSTPMPGKCYLKCAVGETVQKGQVLYELECMKMLTSFRAERDGTVLEIYAKEGAILEAHQPILRVC